MSKIICDICGTSYPETAKQCPICGCVRPGDVQRVTNEVKTDGKVSTGYTYVKGGRFSKSNVKKRTQAQSHSTGTSKEVTPKSNKNGEEKDNRGLVIVAIVLLLAIIGVVIYIALRYFAPISDPNHGGSSTSTTGQNMVDLSCTDLSLDTDTILFEQIGEARLLQVSIEPKNTSDSIRFRSEDETVATVNEVGKITAVGEGTTTIVITCGQITKECTVTCQLPQESTGVENTVDTTGPEESTGPQETLRLNRTDMTLSYKGESWVLYDGDIAKNLITWSSDNENYVTFVDGVVVAVANNPDGVTVHAEYAGQKVSCIVRCNFKESSGIAGSGGVSEDGGGVSEDGGSSSGSVAGTVTGTVNVNESLRVRSGPGTNYDIVGSVLAKEKVTITERQTASDGVTWGKISTGWISLDYVVLDN